jgi:hypothetical protein
MVFIKPKHNAANVNYYELCSFCAKGMNSVPLISAQPPFVLWGIGVQRSTESVLHAPVDVTNRTSTFFPQNLSLSVFHMVLAINSYCLLISMNQLGFVAET